MADSRPVHISESRMVVPLNTWVLISNFKLSYTMVRRSDGTLDRPLADYLDRTVSSNTIPVDGVFSFDRLIDRSIGLLLRIYRTAPPNGAIPSILDLEKPLGNDIVPVIIFFHGGSFVHSSVNTTNNDTKCRRIVSHCQCLVIAVDYRLAPENPYPCAYEDGLAALKWVHSRDWLRSGRACKPYVYLAGDSAGGNIAHNVAVMALGYDLEIAGNILMNPMFGGEERTKSEQILNGRFFVTCDDRDWYWKAFLPEGADRSHPACNPFGPKAVSLEGVKFPKSLVVVSGLDLIHEWQLAYVEGLRKAGQDVTLLYMNRATIGFYLMPNCEFFHRLMEEIRNFVRHNRREIEIGESVNLQ